MSSSKKVYVINSHKCHLVNLLNLTKLLCEDKNVYVVVRKVLYVTKIYLMRTGRFSVSSMNRGWLL